MNPVPKNNLISTKSIVEMLSYLRIEKDGTEIKNTLLQPNIQHCIRIVDNTYKLEDKDNKIEIKSEFEIRVKHKEGKKIFSCELKDIYKIVNKQRNEGKLTILIEKDRSKYNIFLFKSTKEAIWLNWMGTGLVAYAAGLPVLTTVFSLATRTSLSLPAKVMEADSVTTPV